MSRDNPSADVSVNPRPRGRVVPGGAGESPVGAAPRRYPPWMDPPLPTPSGTVAGATTVGSVRARGDGAYLIGAGCRFPILFGRLLIVPDIAYAAQETYGATQYGDFRVILSDGEIDSIESWYYTSPDGTPTTAIPVDKLLPTVGNGMHGAYEAIETRLGTLSQAAIDGILGPLRGVAHAKLTGDPRDPILPACLAKGRKLFDPRLGSWGSGEYPDPSKCAFAANPSLEMADIVTSTQYGLGVPASLVDWTAFSTFASYCDEIVNGNKRYECHIYVRETRTVWEWLETIGAHAGGAHIREVDGLWTVDWPRSIGTVDAVIKYEDVVTGSRPRVSYGGGAGLADVPNRFIAEWTDSSSPDWPIRQVVINHAEVEAGAAVRESTVYKLHGCLLEDQAYRCLWQIAYSTWSEVGITGMDLPVRFMHLKVGSRVTLLMPELGFPSQDFLVTEAAYTGAGIQVTLALYDPNVFTPGTPGTGGLPPSGYYDTPAALTGAAFDFPEVEVTATTPTSKTEISYLGAKWDVPTFAYAQDVIVRLWDSAGPVTWDTAGYTEIVRPPSGDSRFITSVARVSMKPKAGETDTFTFDALGNQTMVNHAGAAETIMLKLRSLAGNLSSAVTVSRSAFSTDFPTPPATVVVETPTTPTPKSGQVAVWDTVSGKLAWGPALAWDETNKRLGVNKVSPQKALDIGVAHDVSQEGEARLASEYLGNPYGISLVYGLTGAGDPYRYIRTYHGGTTVNAVTFGGAGEAAFASSLSVASNVGIGTDVAASRLHVMASGASATSPQVIISDSGTHGGTGKELLIGYIGASDRGSIQAAHWGTAYTPLILNPAGGNVGVGTSDPAYFSLEVAGAVGPHTTFLHDLGANYLRWRSLYASELRVETLVAQNTIATIGGRILVGPTTKLTVDIFAAYTQIQVEHNQMVNGDIVYLESAPGGVQQVEFMQITSAPSGTGPYLYNVTRNLDGTGANDWKAGDAVFNTGQAGNGFIDLYSVRGTKAATEYGPTIVGNVRGSATFNDWTPRWAVGNLNGLYGYATNEYGAAFGVPSGAWVKIDPTNGVRIGHNATTRVQIDAAGNATFTGTVTAAAGAIGGWTIGATELAAGSSACIRAGQTAYDTGVGFWLGDVGGTKKFSLGDSTGNKLTWNGAALSLTGGITATVGYIGGWTIGASWISSGGIVLQSSGTPASNKIYVGAGAYGGATTAFYADGSGRFSLNNKVLWDGSAITINAGNVTLDSNGIWIPPGGAGRTSSFGFVSGSTWIGGTYGSAGTRNAVGLTAQKGSYGATVECSTDGTAGGGKVTLVGLLDAGNIAATGYVTATSYVTATTYITAGTNITAGGSVSAGTSFYCNGNQVVGSRGAAVADATDAATAITQLNALLARCRAHGLIA